MMVMDVVYWMILSDDKEVKLHRILKRMKVMHLHYHDDVLMKMVQQISVYNLDDIINKTFLCINNLLGSHSSSAYAASDAFENDI